MDKSQTGGWIAAGLILGIPNLPWCLLVSVLMLIVCVYADGTVILL